MKFKIFAQFLVLILFFSCTKNSELETALQLAGDNRAELEKVLSHYSKNPSDSLKLRAAEFLISNMVYHYTIESKSLSDYYVEISNFNKTNNNFENYKFLYDSLGKKYSANINQVKMKYDINIVSSEFLISIIEQAIQHWKSTPWVSHLSFAEFCEYVLPYRICNENLEIWWEDLRSTYITKIDWIQNIDDVKLSSYFAATILNDTLKKERKINIYPYNKVSNISMPASTLINIQLGTCEDYAASALYKMRACGIPSCIDFTPQYPNRSGGHTWNVLFGELGREFPFMGGEQGPGFYSRATDQLAKVYRKTFAYQYGSLFHLKKDEIVPPFFDTPYLKDVTNHYISTTDVVVELSKKTNKNFAYLSVFNNAEWIPIEWGKVINGKNITFNNVGKNCMYLPIVFNEGDYLPMGKPFYINCQNNIVEVNASKLEKQTLLLERKYPIKKLIYLNSLNIIGTKFEASNRANFNDSVLIAEISSDPKFYWDTLHTKTNTKYRYWKIKGSDVNTITIAELQLYYNNKNISNNAKLSCSVYSESEAKPFNAFDNNPLTYSQLKRKSNEYIILDFGKPVAVDYFRFLPRNDDNAINAGDSYELMLWGESGWKSLIKCTAKADKLQFKNVPSGGLYLLRNHTKGKEERIFTYENGKQVWW